MKRPILALAASLLAVSAFAAPVTSGLKPGSPVGAFDVVDVTGPRGPKAEDIASYKINPEASSTVMLWRKGAVHATFANVDAKGWGEVVKAADSMMK